MRYGFEYLLKRGIMLDAEKGTVQTKVGEVEFLYSKLSRMFFIELVGDLAPSAVFQELESKYMFDFAWILDSGLHVYRTYGMGRAFELSSEEVDNPPEEVRIKLETLEPQGVPFLFDKTSVLEEVSSHLWNIRLELANSLGVGMSAKDRLLAAQSLIEQAIVSGFLSQSESSCSALDSSRFGEGALSLIHQELSNYDFTRDATISEPDSLSPYVLNWIFETFTCALMNMSEAEVTKSLRLKPLKRKNRRTGSFYTPEHLAHDIVVRSLQRWLLEETGLNILSPTEIDIASPSQRLNVLERLREVTILDPSAGAGVFLFAAAEWLLRARSILGDDRKADQIKREIVARNLYAVDIMEGATATCRLRLHLWMNSDSDDLLRSDLTLPLANTRSGNSLVGRIRLSDAEPDYFSVEPFHWEPEFPTVFNELGNGFDVIVGNPPYGNILTEDERRVLKNQYGQYVNGGRSGTWNVASMFIVRSRFLLRANGQLGLLLPNSILRVGQFTRTREFIIKEMKLEQIIDEGSPFDGVTLEMVSLFCTASFPESESEVEVISRRPGMWETNKVPLSVLGSGRLFVIYHDDLFGEIKRKSQTGVLKAGRGRDIPHNHVNREPDGKFRVPYATSGRSIKRYRLDFDHVIHADDWFYKDPALMDSYRSEFLIATKNYPFPRCLIKPKGVVHGGGAVRIQVLHEDMQEEALGLILNSTLSRFVCRRYLTNASQLTTCLNTGIMEEFPVVCPDEQKPFVVLFRTLQKLYQEAIYEGFSLEREYLETISDALVFELYLLNGSHLLDAVEQTLVTIGDTAMPEAIFEALNKQSIRERADEICTLPTVSRITNSPLLVGA